MAISRMQFLRGDFSGRSAPIRPPWSLDEAEFIERCQRCGACAEACSQHIIRPGRGDFPEIDFTAGECLFCGDCVAVCEPRALYRQAQQTPWTVTAVLDTKACIAFMGVECRGCTDPCEPRAIRIAFRPGGVGTPRIDQSACTGCGACARVCPAQALTMLRESVGVAS